MQHTEGRYPSTTHVTQFFSYEHLPEPLQTVSAYSHHL